MAGQYLDNPESQGQTLKRCVRNMGGHSVARLLAVHPFLLELQEHEICMYFRQHEWREILGGSKDGYKLPELLVLVHI